MSKPQEIPVPVDTPLWKERVTLSGRDYILRGDYLEREQRWYLSFYTVGEEPLALGIKLVSNWPLLRGYTDNRLPKGEIMAVDTVLGGEPPVFEDLGRRVNLIYFPE